MKVMRLYGTKVKRKLVETRKILKILGGIKLRISHGDGSVEGSDDEGKKAKEKPFSKEKKKKRVRIVEDQKHRRSRDHG